MKIDAMTRFIAKSQGGYKDLARLNTGADWQLLYFVDLEIAFVITGFGLALAFITFFIEVLRFQSRERATSVIRVTSGHRGYSQGFLTHPWRGSRFLIKR